MSRYLLNPALPRTGEPDTTHHLRLADIQRGDPRDELFLIDRWSEHHASLPHNGRDDRPGEPQGRQVNLVLVLNPAG
jgi:hypothetical protein